MGTLNPAVTLVVMKRPLGMFLILIGGGSILFASFPWLYIQFQRFANPRPYHYYFVDDSAKASCIAIAAVGFALIGTGYWLYSVGASDVVQT